LNFLAVGITGPACFSRALDIRQIKCIVLRNDAVCAELKTIITYAKGKGVAGDWLAELEKRVRRYEHPTMLQSYAPRLHIAWQLAKSGEWQQVTAKLKKKVLGSL
jgi:hypothetical protein